LRSGDSRTGAESGQSAVQAGASSVAMVEVFLPVHRRKTAQACRSNTGKPVRLSGRFLFGREVKLIEMSVRN
jgi:hypothetical protein